MVKKINKLTGRSFLEQAVGGVPVGGGRNDGGGGGGGGVTVGRAGDGGGGRVAVDDMVRGGLRVILIVVVVIVVVLRRQRAGKPTARKRLRDTNCDRKVPIKIRTQRARLIFDERQYGVDSTRFSFELTRGA